MEKPKKKDDSVYVEPYADGYNEAIDDYEASLPSEDELFFIIAASKMYATIQSGKKMKVGEEIGVGELAKAISKRLRG